VAVLERGEYRPSFNVPYIITKWSLQSTVPLYRYILQVTQILPI